jgi:hypothetical protein
MVEILQMTPELLALILILQVEDFNHLDLIVFKEEDSLLLLDHFLSLLDM